MAASATTSWGLAVREERGLEPDVRQLKGFVEVTKDNLSLHLSEHFTLGQFITKDQISVWPKYVVLQPRLLDSSS
jgi:hypothetical protein